MTETPASLLDRLRQPTDASAWEQFVTLFGPLMHRWALLLGARGPDAEDLVQDVFVVLYRHLPGFRYDPQRSFRAWLRTVIHHAWLKRRRPPTQSLDEAPEPAVPDPVPELAESEYRAQLVSQALRIIQTDFQPTTWKVFWELAVVGRSGTDVAREFGLSVNAAYLARTRVVSRLRQELDGLLD